MYKSDILNWIKLLDWVITIAFLILIVLWIVFPSESNQVNWDWSTKEPYYFIFSCLMAFSLGLTWRILIDFIKFQMTIALLKANKGERP
jgi:hypothetical protein